MTTAEAMPCHHCRAGLEACNAKRMLSGRHCCANCRHEAATAETPGHRPLKYPSPDTAGLGPLHTQRTSPGGPLPTAAADTSPAVANLPPKKNFPNEGTPRD